MKHTMRAIPKRETKRLPRLKQTERHRVNLVLLRNLYMASKAAA